MDEYTIDILSSSKDEFTARIITLLAPEIIKNMDEIYKQSQEISKNKNNLAVFQRFLADIPKWTPENVIIESDKLKKKLNCEYLDELISCIFIIQLKYLSAIRPSPKNKTIQLNIPESHDFIWKIYINSAKKLYKNVYLYAFTEEQQDILKNKRTIELLVREAILETIRNYIPMGELLKLLMEKDTMKSEGEPKGKITINNVDEVLEQNGKIAKNTVNRNKNNKNLYGSIDEDDDLPYSQIYGDVDETKDLNKEMDDLEMEDLNKEMDDLEMEDLNKEMDDKEMDDLEMEDLNKEMDDKEMDDLEMEDLNKKEDLEIGDLEMEDLNKSIFDDMEVLSSKNKLELHDLD
jgi:hypothetical protein